MHKSNCSCEDWGKWDQRIKGKDFQLLPLQNIVWSCIYTNQFKKLSVSILAMYFSFSILLRALHQYSSKCWLWGGQRVHLASTSPRSQAQGISYILVGCPIFLVITSCWRCKTTIPGSKGDRQSLPGWVQLQPGPLQKLGACSKIMQEIPVKK